MVIGVYSKRQPHAVAILDPYRPLNGMYSGEACVRGAPGSQHERAASMTDTLMCLLMLKSDAEGTDRLGTYLKAFIRRP